MWLFIWRKTFFFLFLRMIFLKITRFVSLKIMLWSFQAQKMKDMNLPFALELITGRKCDCASICASYSACISRFFVFWVTRYIKKLRAACYRQSVRSCGGLHLLFWWLLGGTPLGGSRINIVWFQKVPLLHIPEYEQSQWQIIILNSCRSKVVQLWWNWFLFHGNRLKTDETVQCGVTPYLKKSPREIKVPLFYFPVQISRCPWLIILIFLKWKLMRLIFLNSEWSTCLYAYDMSFEHNCDCRLLPINTGSCR